VGIASVSRTIANHPRVATIAVAATAMPHLTQVRRGREFAPAMGAGYPALAARGRRAPAASPPLVVEQAGCHVQHNRDDPIKGFPLFTDMQEALTIAGWLAVVVFVLAALGDGRAYRLIHGLIAAVVWIIDRWRAWRAHRAQKAPKTATEAEAGDGGADTPRRPKASS